MKAIRDTRARASGFGPKLVVFYARAISGYDRGPRNKEQLAAMLKKAERTCSPSTVGGWTTETGRRSLPEARFIRHIEQIMGAPWAYLDDPTTAWPPNAELAAVFRLALAVRSEDRDRLANDLLALIRRRRGASP